MTDFRVVALALGQWDSAWMNRQHLLSRLAMRHPVLYSTGPWSLWERQAPARADAPWFGRLVLRDGVLVDQPARMLLTWPYRERWEQIVARLMARRWRRGLSGEGPLVLIVYHPDHYALVKAVKADYVVYYAYDQFNLTAGWTEIEERFQAELARSADLVVASATTMADAIQGYSPNPVRVLPNGADVAAFVAAAEADVPEPAELAAIPHPRIGYVGNINSKVDFKLIATLARREPAWQFVFVGGRGMFDEVSRRWLDECETLPNIHFLGPRKHTELPAYTAAMDVNTMCYRVAEGIWAVAGYPLKLHEYLATGKPVIGADLIVLREFTSVLRIAKDADEWHDAIVDALDKGGVADTESRRQVAAENSWDHRVEVFDRWLSEMVSEKPAPGI